MKVYWRYTCDYGHQWTLFRDENTEESSEDEFCPWGHEAVTLRKDVPIDEVVITFLPAGFIGDRIKNQVVQQGKYFFVLTDRVGGNDKRTSQQTYGWQEAIKLAERFRGLSREKAWKLWNDLNP
jgi:hypothetical protein